MQWAPGPKGKHPSNVKVARGAAKGADQDSVKQPARGGRAAGAAALRNGKVSSEVQYKQDLLAELKRQAEENTRILERERAALLAMEIEGVVRQSLDKGRQAQHIGPSFAGAGAPAYVPQPAAAALQPVRACVNHRHFDAAPRTFEPAQVPGLGAPQHSSHITAAPSQPLGAHGRSHQLSRQQEQPPVTSTSSSKPHVSQPRSPRHGQRRVANDNATKSNRAAAHAGRQQLIPEEPASPFAHAETLRSKGPLSPGPLGATFPDTPGHFRPGMVFEVPAGDELQLGQLGQQEEEQQQEDVWLRNSGQAAQQQAAEQHWQQQERQQQQRWQQQEEAQKPHDLQRRNSSGQHVHWPSPGGTAQIMSSDGGAASAEALSPAEQERLAREAKQRKYKEELEQQIRERDTIRRAAQQQQSAREAAEATRAGGQLPPWDPAAKGLRAGGGGEPHKDASGRVVADMRGQQVQQQQQQQQVQVQVWPPGQQQAQVLQRQKAPQRWQGQKPQPMERGESDPDPDVGCAAGMAARESEAGVTSPGGPGGRSFMGSMSELVAGPSAQQREAAEQARQQLLLDLEAQVREKRERAAAAAAQEAAAAAKEEAALRAHYQQLNAEAESERARRAGSSASASTSNGTATSGHGNKSSANGHASSGAGPGAANTHGPGAALAAEGSGRGGAMRGVDGPAVGGGQLRAAGEGSGVGVGVGPRKGRRRVIDAPWLDVAALEVGQQQHQQHLQQHEHGPQQQQSQAQQGSGGGLTQEPSSSQAALPAARASRTHVHVPGGLSAEASRQGSQMDALVRQLQLEQERMREEFSRALQALQHQHPHGPPVGTSHDRAADANTHTGVDRAPGWAAERSSSGGPTWIELPTARSSRGPTELQRAHSGMGGNGHGERSRGANELRRMHSGMRGDASGEPAWAEEQQWQAHDSLDRFVVDSCLLPANSNSIPEGLPPMSQPEWQPPADVLTRHHHQQQLPADALEHWHHGSSGSLPKSSRQRPGALNGEAWGRRSMKSPGKGPRKESRVGSFYGLEGELGTNSTSSFGGGFPSGPPAGRPPGSPAILRGDHLVSPPKGAKRQGGPGSRLLNAAVRRSKPASLQGRQQG